MKQLIYLLFVLSLGVLPVMGQTPSPIDGWQFVDWVDPNEDAFTVQVPIGWMVEGGMHDALGRKHLAYTLMSPDMNILIFVGQSETLISLQPTDDLARQGYTEGSVVYSDSGFNVRVAAYKTGVEAAAELVDAGIGQVCNQITLVNGREIPEQSGWTEDQTAYISAGEIEYRCVIDGIIATGYQYATTYATRDPRHGEIWMIQNIYGFLAEQSRVQDAVTALVYSLTTFQFHEAWVVEQVRIQEQMAQQQQQQQYQQQMNNMNSHYASLSYMSAMNHQTMMTIIHNMGDYEWEWSYDW